MRGADPHADLLLHAGDFMTAAAYGEIEALGQPLLAVRGNVDDAELTRLPEAADRRGGWARIAMLHDSGAAAGRLERMQARFGDRADALVFGHSHLPLHEQSDGFQIFNPGSPTERRRAPKHTMGLASVEDRKLLFSLVDLT